MAQLQTGIHYSAQTFGSDFKPSIDINSLRTTAGLCIGDSLTIENSFSGLCECVFIALIWKSLPADENHHDLPWVIISNFYLGSGEEELLDGSCGSPVLMEGGELSAFSVSRQTMARLFLNFFFKFNYSQSVRAAATLRAAAAPFLLVTRILLPNRFVRCSMSDTVSAP